VLDPLINDREPPLPVLPVPAEIEALPPVAPPMPADSAKLPPLSSALSPALISATPPVPVVVAPTDTLNVPALPAPEAPVDSDMSPAEPAEAEPVDKVNDPVEPTLESAEASMIAPLEEVPPAPLRSETEPPVICESPAEMSTSPPDVD
jgi:hypothetical protein